MLSCGFVSTPHGTDAKEQSRGRRCSVISYFPYLTYLHNCVRMVKRLSNFSLTIDVYGPIASRYELHPSPRNAQLRARCLMLIRKAWNKSVEGFLEAGALLVEAKSKLEHGQFESMISRDVPFTVSTARRLMMVARHSLISNRAHAHDLPPSWYTLYDLTKVPLPTLEAALEDGRNAPRDGTGEGGVKTRPRGNT